MTWSIGKRQGSKGFNPLETPSLTGFTFLEILMVIVILGIFVAIAAPRLQTTFLDLELQSQASNLATFLRYAQERAVLEGRIYRFESDRAARRYWLKRASPEEEGNFERIEGRYGRVMQLPPGITPEFPEEEILFYPDGSAEPFTVSLRNTQGAERFLKRERPFGVVRVEEMPQS